MNRIETEVSIVLSRSSNRDRPWHLIVTDKRSGVLILEAEFDHATFADMMSSTQAGNLAKAEVALVPWIGKYAIRHSEVVDTAGISYDKVAEVLNEEGEMLAKDMRRDHGDSSDLGWRYIGSQGGGGGSMNRTLTFVRFSDEKP